MDMRIASNWQVGGAITLCETPSGPDYKEHGTLLVFEPGRLLRFNHWSPLWRLPEVAGNRAVVTLQIEPDDNGTRVSFTHELPQVEALAEHSNFFWRVGLGAVE